jgi:subtilase family serine protease
VASVPRARIGSVPKLPRSTRIGGSVASSARLDLTVSLTGRDPLGMQRLAQAVATPGSPEYRDYITVGQFADRFGAPAAQVAAVTRTLRADGLKVSPVSANRMMLSVSGTVAKVQDAFATRLDSVRTADGRRAYADRRAPTLPVSIASDVDAVIGLNTLYRPQSDQVVHDARPLGDTMTGHSVAHVATGGPQPCAAATSASENPDVGGYTADEIQAAYNFSGLYAAGDLGAGQSVAVYELEKVNPADLAAYQACYGTHAKVSYVNTGQSHFTDDEEAGLDVEQIIGLAPDIHVIVYQAPDSFTVGVKQFNKIVSQNRARTVSVSWGLCEAKITFDHSDLSIVRAEDKIFQEAALQGQSVLSASGDTGSAGCETELDSSRLAVQDPSSQPFVTGVGGTTLYTEVDGQLGLWNPNVAGDPLMQAVWNDGEIKTSRGKEPAASTGGLSAVWAMPRYQHKATAALGVVGALSSGDCREVPDVSADGDPATGYVVYVSAGSTHAWTSEGGTSAAAPLWAALTAEADALPACRGASLGFENPAIYSLAAQPGNFADITAANPLTNDGNNDAVGANHGLYPVTAGYDMTTGLGTPNAAAVASGLCTLRAPIYNVSIAAPKRHQIIVRSRVRLHFGGADSGNLKLRFTAHGLPKGLSISRRGIISGRARRAGRYNATITATDHATNKASLAFPITVLSSPATIRSVFLSGVSHRHPTLAFSVTKGRYAPRLRGITIHLPAGLTFGPRERGIHVSSGSHRVHFRVLRTGTTLTLTFRRGESTVRIRVGRPSLVASRALARTARRDHRAKVHVGIDATDRRHRTTRRGYQLKIH